MNRPRIFLLVISLAAFVVLCCYFIGGKIRAEYNVEAGFRQQFGDDWKKFYEKRYGEGSLQHAHTEIMVGFASMPVIAVLLWLICRQITRYNNGGSTPPRRKPPKQKNQW